MLEDMVGRESSQLCVEEEAGCNEESVGMRYWWMDRGERWGRVSNVVILEGLIQTRSVDCEVSWLNEFFMVFFDE